MIFGVVQIAEEIINDPQMHLNGIFAPVKDPQVGARYTVNSPVQVAGVDKVSPARAPRLGGTAMKCYGSWVSPPMKSPVYSRRAPP